jgi:Type IV secretion-system coupling protein DNA-binding domain
VIADPNGGNLASFYDRARGDVILNPFDARPGKWSAFADIGSIQDTDLLARTLIPDAGSVGNSAREW